MVRFVLMMGLFYDQVMGHLENHHTYSYHSGVTPIVKPIQENVSLFNFQSEL